MADVYFKTGVFVREDIDEKRRKAGTSETLIRMGEQLRNLRKSLGLSRSDLAVRCDTNADQLGRFEHGIGSISLVSLRKLCETLNVDLVSLISTNSGRSPEMVRQSLQMAESWKGKPLSLEDFIGF